MLKGVIFDLDHTLYNEDHYFLAVLRVFSDQTGLTYSELEAAYTRIDRIHSKDIFGDLLTEIGLNTPERQNHLFELYKTAPLAAGTMPLFDDAIQILGFLKQQGVQIGIITNGVLAAQENKVMVLNLHLHCDAIVCARQWGAMFEKPHPRSFEECLTQLGLDKDSVVFVGDTLGTDIAGAIAAGIRPVLLSRPPLVIAYPGTVITNLMQLKELFFEEN